MREIISVYLNKEATAAANRRIAERYAYYSSIEEESDKKTKKKKNTKTKNNILDEGGPNLS